MYLSHRTLRRRLQITSSINETIIPKPALESQTKPNEWLFFTHHARVLAPPTINPTVLNRPPKCYRRYARLCSQRVQTMTTFKSLSGMMQEDSCAARAGDLTVILVTKENRYVQIRIAISLDGWAVERLFTKESKGIVWMNKEALMLQYPSLRRLCTKSLSRHHVWILCPGLAGHEKSKFSHALSTFARLRLWALAVAFVFPIAMLLVKFLLTALTLLLKALDNVDSTTHVTVVIPGIKAIARSIIKA
jgi:uncharacterized protein (DUF2141 family)